MRSRPGPLLALIALTLAALFLLACSSAAAHAPVKHPDIIECGGPMAGKVAQRASELALKHAASDEASRAELERLIIAEIKNVAAEYGPDLVGCLIDKALNAHRQPLALQRRLHLAAPYRDVEHIAGAGFVPITRDLVHARPWHTLLAGARGVRT